MTDPNFFILYVDNVEASTAFYARLLGETALEASPGFAMFSLSSGVMLGLWSRHTALPAPEAAAGGMELAISVNSHEAVAHLFAKWTDWRLTMVQPITDLDFGRTFVALDPDGHRLRVFAANS